MGTMRWNIINISEWYGLLSFLNFFYVGLAFYFFRQLVPKRNPSIPSCTLSRSCGSSRYKQSVRIPQITIVKLVTLLKICSKYRSTWFIYTFVYKLQDIRFIDILYLQHFICAMMRTNNNLINLFITIYNLFVELHHKHHKLRCHS